jgi:hypothetical protein
MARRQLSASAVTMVPLRASILSSLGTAVISLDLASVAICANTSRCSEPQALTMCRADPVKRTAQDLAIDGHHTLQVPGKLRHKPLQRIAKLIRIEIAEQTAESVVTGKAVGEGEKAAQKRLLGLGKHSHIYRALAAAKHAA